MITELPRQELVAMGARLRLAYLIEQAGYTLGLASCDGEPLAGLLPPGFLDEARLVLDQLSSARGDRVLIEAEAKDARRVHVQAFAEAKVWRRTVTRRATLARRLGKTLPDGLVKISSVHTPQALAVQVLNMVDLAEANLGQLTGTGWQELIAQGRALASALQSADATQELKRYSQLPTAVANFYEQKGILYVGLKAINDAGQALHAGNTARSSQYNLAILYRRGAPRPAEDEPEPEP